MQYNKLDAEITDAIMERPFGFEIGKKSYNLYPLTLGKSMLVGRLINKLDIDSSLLRLNPAAEALRLVETKREIATQIVSYLMAANKSEVFNEKLNKLRNRALNSLNAEDMSSLLLYALSCDNTDRFIAHIGLDKDSRDREKIHKIKQSKNNRSYTFGGRSVYGSLIDRACERYGWTFDYVVWGISYTNLRLMLLDSITEISLSKEEAKKVHISDRGAEVIKADDPQNWARIKNMYKEGRI